MLLVPQVHSGGRTSCVPLVSPDHSEIKKQVNKMKRTEEGNTDNRKTWIGDGKCQGKQEERGKDGQTLCLQEGNCCPCWWLVLAGGWVTVLTWVWIYIYIYNLIFKYHKKLLRFETTSHRVNSELSKPSGCTVAADFCCSLCTQFPCSILAGPLASGFPLPPPLKPPHRGWPPPSSLHQTCLRAVQQMENGAREMVRKIWVNIFGLCCANNPCSEAFAICAGPLLKLREESAGSSAVPLWTTSAFTKFALGAVWNSAAPKQ